MDMREILATRSLNDAILHLHERIEALEAALTKPEPVRADEPVTEKEEETDNG